MYLTSSKGRHLAFALLILAGVTAGTAHAQASRGAAIGALGYGLNEAITGDNVQYPIGEGWFDTRMLQNHGIIVGVERQWTDPSGKSWPYQVAMVAQNKFTDIKTVSRPTRGQFKRVFRNQPPQKVLDGNDFTQLFDRPGQDPVDPSIPSDVMFYTQTTTWPSTDASINMGIQIERWVYLFSHPSHDDYAIQEWVIKNTASERREGVYVGLLAETNGHAQYPADLWGTYDPARRMYYSWDGHRRSEKYDTKGDPDTKWGVLREPQYMGFAVLHADRSATDESDDPAQPQKAGWSQREKSPDLSIATQDVVYQFLRDAWDDNPGDGTYAEYDANRRYRTMMEGVNLQAQDTNTEQEKTGLLSFGPYTLEPGQDVRIVTALAGGSIPLRLAIDVGHAYHLAGAGGQLETEIWPADRDIVDMHGNLIMRDGNIYDPAGNLVVDRSTWAAQTSTQGSETWNTLTREQKDAVIDIGKELMFSTVDLAKQAWETGNVKSGTGTFNIPFAPAAPSVEGFSEGDRIRLAWEDNTQDGRGGAPVKWRVYRDYKRPPTQVAPTDTTFYLLAELDAGTTEYTDEDVTRGREYYYYVTAVNADGVESNPFQNRTGTSATRSDESLTARQPALTSGWQDKVVVVPNPYHIQSAENTYGGGNRRLNFLNLPAFANIRIYTMLGDEIQVIEHNADAGDEDWQRQDTFSTMEIVSGVYLYVVEKLDGPNGSPTGEKAVGKFVVIK